MIFHRRSILLGFVGVALCGCQSGVAATSSASGVQYSGHKTAMRSANSPAFEAWVRSVKLRARANGIGQRTINQAFRTVKFLPEVIERDRNQAEKVRSFEDYIAIAASDDRIEKGKAMLRKHRALLANLFKTYGVEPEVIVAIWGLESRYGERRGDVPVISALSSLAFDGRRGKFFETQLMAALRILENGDVPLAHMTGSWAGAMGHTQFIPTSFEAYAVDFNNDARRDIWSNDPTDALASTAAYLQRSGWKSGALWGMELTGSASGQGRLVRPAGPTGPVFELYHNAKVLGRYNNAQKYIIGVGHLSDRLVGKPAFKAQFGPDANGMRLVDRKALQRGLNRAGFDVGEADGVIGKKTMEAVNAFQKQKGLAVTGQPSLSLLSLLR